MYRDIETDLLHWKHEANRMPILLRGARQVGKSYLVEKFSAHFEHFVVVNFELQPELCSCFETLHPNDILTNLSLVTHNKIIPGKTLLFLDEIQDCPNAIRALRYFKEKMPELHVIGAGSLLEFTLNQADFRMPVGRVQSLYLRPLSFKEYLTAASHEDLREFIEKIDIKKPIALPLHQALLKQIRLYLSLGGMPGILSHYFSSAHQYDFNEIKSRQTFLLSNYRQDFGKYAKHSQIPYLHTVFEKAPGLIGSHIKYVKIDPDARSEQLKIALELLQSAGLIYPVYSTSASGLPLMTHASEKKFKIVFVDVGLVVRATRTEAELLLDDFIFVNRGAIAEQFVGQELAAATPSYEETKLYFWSRDKKSSMAEVDFLTTVNSYIVPIEVKAGSTGQLKSLHLLMEEKKLKIGVRVSQQPLHFDGKILSIPFYLVSEISRLVKMI